MIVYPPVILEEMHKDFQSKIAEKLVMIAEILFWTSMATAIIGFIVSFFLIEFIGIAGFVCTIIIWIIVQLIIIKYLGRAEELEYQHKSYSELVSISHYVGTIYDMEIEKKERLEQQYKKRKKKFKRY